MNQKAFSLIELLTVLTLISVVVSIGFFVATNVQETMRMNSLAASAEQIQADIVNFIITERPTSDDFRIDLIPADDAYPEIKVKSTDPWGGDYSKVYAMVLRVENHLYVDVYFEVPNQGCYVRYEGTTKMHRKSTLCD